MTAEHPHIIRDGNTLRYRTKVVKSLDMARFIALQREGNPRFSKVEIRPVKNGYYVVYGAANVNREEAMKLSLQEDRYQRYLNERDGWELLYVSPTRITIKTPYRSKSQPGGRYVVTRDSCTCPDSQTCQRLGIVCKHVHGCREILDAQDRQRSGNAQEIRPALDPERDF